MPRPAPSSTRYARLRELWGEILATGGARVYSLLVSLVTLVVTARVLGAEGRGILAAVTTWVALVATVGYLSLGQVAAHRAAEAGNRQWLPSTLGTLMALTVVIGAAGWLVAGVLYLATDSDAFGLKGSVLAVGFLSLPFLVWEQYGSALLAAVGHISIYNRAQIVGRTLGLAAFAVGIALGGGVYAVLLATLLGQIVVALRGIRQLIREAEQRIRPSREALRSLLRGGALLHLNAIGTFLFTSTAILIVNHYEGADETGIYQFAVQLIATLLVVPNAASLVLLGGVARNGPEAAWLDQRRVLLWMTAGMGGLAVISALAAPWIIPLVAGHEFDDSVRVFQLLLIAAVGMTFCTVVAPQWIGRGMFWQASAITLTVGIVNVVLNLILVPRHGIDGAVVATLATYALAVATNAWMVLRCERGTRYSRSFADARATD